MLHAHWTAVCVVLARWLAAMVTASFGSVGQHHRCQREQNTQMSHYHIPLKLPKCSTLLCVQRPAIHPQTHVQVAAASLNTTTTYLA